MKNQKNKKKVKKSNNVFARSFTMKRGTALYQYIVLSLHMSALLTSCKHETFRRCVFKQYRRTKTIQLVRSYAEQLKLLARFSRQFRAYDVEMFANPLWKKSLLVEEFETVDMAVILV